MLKPVSEAYLDPISTVAGGVIIDLVVKGATLEKPFKWPFPFPGGIRGPHIHFEKNIYLLDEKQWRDFSGRIMKDIQSRIANANSVSFDQLLDNFLELQARFLDLQRQCQHYQIRLTRQKTHQPWQPSLTFSAACGHAGGGVLRASADPLDRAIRAV